MWEFLYMIAIFGVVTTLTVAHRRENFRYIWIGMFFGAIIGGSIFQPTYGPDALYKFIAIGTIIGGFIDVQRESKTK